MSLDDQEAVLEKKQYLFEKSPKPEPEPPARPRRAVQFTPEHNAARRRRYGGSDLEQEYARIYHQCDDQHPEVNQPTAGYTRKQFGWAGHHRRNHIMQHLVLYPGNRFLFQIVVQIIIYIYL